MGKYVLWTHEDVSLEETKYVELGTVEEDFLPSAGQYLEFQEKIYEVVRVSHVVVSKEGKLEGIARVKVEKI